MITLILLQTSSALGRGILLRNRVACCEQWLSCVAEFWDAEIPTEDYADLRGSKTKLECI